MLASQELAGGDSRPLLLLLWSATRVELMVMVLIKYLNSNWEDVRRILQTIENRVRGQTLINFSFSPRSNRWLWLGWDRARRYLICRLGRL